MFNKEDERTKVLVELVMSDSRRLKGNMLIPPISTLQRQLNNDTLFLEFEDFNGGLHMVAKQAMGEIIIAPNPKAAKLDPKPLDRRNTPHMELALEPDASADEIEAGHAAMLAKYDPAKFENMDLPAEVMAYFTAKRANIEAAYNFLSDSADTEAA